MSDALLSAIDGDAAGRLMRHLEPDDALEAGILTPMAGTRVVRLFSLEEAERFLVVHDGSATDHGNMRATVNYVDPARLSQWIAEKFGDTELASALDELIATRKAYGFLVPDFKALLAERIGQCEELLATVSDGQA
ncbi:MAG: hypothetical protein RBS17_02085 [Coriobacteriia bacterium]|nr:hypothetical protein [Coriobacteriia bacterium]